MLSKIGICLVASLALTQGNMDNYNSMTGEVDDTGRRLQGDKHIVDEQFDAVYKATVLTEGGFMTQEKLEGIMKEMMATELIDEKTHLFARLVAQLLHCEVDMFGIQPIKGGVSFGVNAIHQKPVLVKDISGKNQASSYWANNVPTLNQETEEYLKHMLKLWGQEKYNQIQSELVSLSTFVKDSSTVKGGTVTTGSEFLRNFGMNIGGISSSHTGTSIVNVDAGCILEALIYSVKTETCLPRCCHMQSQAFQAYDERRYNDVILDEEGLDSINPPSAFQAATAFTPPTHDGSLLDSIAVPVQGGGLKDCSHVQKGGDLQAVDFMTTKISEQDSILGMPTVIPDTWAVSLFPTFAICDQSVHTVALDKTNYITTQSGTHEDTYMLLDKNCKPRTCLYSIGAQSKDSFKDLFLDGGVGRRLEADGGIGRRLEADRGIGRRLEADRGIGRRLEADRSMAAPSL